MKWKGGIKERKVALLLDYLNHASERSAVGS